MLQAIGFKGKIVRCLMVGGLLLPTTILQADNSGNNSTQMRIAIIRSPLANIAKEAKERAASYERNTENAIDTLNRMDGLTSAVKGSSTCDHRKDRLSEHKRDVSKANDSMHLGYRETVAAIDKIAKVASSAESYLNQLSAISAAINKNLPYDAAEVELIGKQIDTLEALLIEGIQASDAGIQKMGSAAASVQSIYDEAMKLINGFCLFCAMGPGGAPRP